MATYGQYHLREHERLAVSFIIKQQGWSKHHSACLRNSWSGSVWTAQAAYEQGFVDPDAGKAGNAPAAAQDEGGWKGGSRP